MAGEKKLVKSKEGMNAGFKSAPVTSLAEQNVVPGKDGSRSDSAPSVSSSGDANASMKVQTDQVPVADQSVYYQPTNCYGYYYPGYDGTYPEWDDRCYYHTTDGSEIPYSGVQSDNGSLLYYVPGYNAYATGSMMGVDGQCVGQTPYYPSSGYYQPPYSYGSETMQPHSWNSPVIGDDPAGAAARLAGRKADATSLGPAASGKSRGLNSLKTNGTVDAKVSGLPVDSKSRLSTASSNFSKSTLQNQPLKPLNKVPQLGSDFRSSGFMKSCYPMDKFTPFPNQGHGLFPYNGYMHYRPNGRTWAGGNERFRLKERFGRNGEFEASSELNRGPRARKVGLPLTSSVEKDQSVLSVHRDKYNLPEFQTEYENAKFFVIKSYSEDDIHKSIKYNVWTSTANGNKKLDAAFHEAEAKSGETGKRSPIFLLFSVNGSGQFVGLAEMTGQVDFKKDMNFWQQDKWNGFFPVQWHIVKDIPNVQLRHIILENNDNKPVTNSRDTQEIGFKQGLEMLTIFKSSSPKTSMLDDFNFYEEREKSLHAKRNSKTALSQAEIDMKTEYRKKQLEAAAAAVAAVAGVRKIEEASVRDKITSDPNVASLITLTKNLALNGVC